VGGRGQFSHAFSGEVYDFYIVSSEHFGYTLVLDVTLQKAVICAITAERSSDGTERSCETYEINPKLQAYNLDEPISE
jgi:hypothetical protein